MDFENKSPDWKAAGVEPSAEFKEAGFAAGYKPPASYFNWFWSLVSKCITELQNKLKTTASTANAAMPKNGGTFTGETKVNTGIPTSYQLSNGGALKLLGQNGTGNFIVALYGKDGWISNPINIAADGTVTINEKTVDGFATAAQGVKADNALPKSGGIVTGEVKFNVDVPTTFSFSDGGAVKLLGHSSTGGLIAAVYDESGTWVSNAFAILDDASLRFQSPAIANSPVDSLVRLRNGVVQDSAGTAVESSYLIYRRK